ncbi:MAG: ABC transporter permease subunit [bacterium]|nr:ABC transporter permease subunit [bacterium]
MKTTAPAARYRTATTVADERARTWIRTGRFDSFVTGNLVLVAFAVAALASLGHLGLTAAGLAPGAGGLALAAEFFGHALKPALAPIGNPEAGRFALLAQALRAAGLTVALAAAALSLALAGGALLGLGASGARGGGRAGLALATGCRGIAAFVRSIHELLWAVLLLAAFGRDELVAVLAIAVPYAGVLGKIFSEMIDEAPRDAADALTALGAAPWQSFLFGLVPRAMPDMLAYSFYRFECALRSSAVLGFFGFPTLGYYLAASFENLYYAEVWTYLYVLAGLVVAVDWWSGRLRSEVRR